MHAAIDTTLLDILKFDEQLAQLRARMDDLKLRVIPDFESKAELIYAQIMPLQKESVEREKLEAEYGLQAKELSRRSDELIKVRQEIENLEMEKRFSSR